jgi:uncharacterized membrane protein
MGDLKVQESAARRRERFALLTERRRGLQDRAADQITAFSGSMMFVYLHVLWFTAWIVLNETRWRFDPYPFGLLTLIVSLEAIFLSTFVLFSQNREAARANVRSQIDFETNVLSEAWLEALADKLGIDVAKVHATADSRIAQAQARTDEQGNGHKPPA